LTVKHEALLFVRENGEIISKTITKQHHKIVKAFEDYKEITFNRIKYSYKLEDKLRNLDSRIMVEAPVKEALYALDETNPLSFYNNLVPELTAFREIKMSEISKEKKQQNY